MMNSQFYESLAKESIKNILPLLEELELQDYQRANAFSINASNVRTVIQTRLELFQSVYFDFVELCQTLQLSPFPNQTLWHIWLPLAKQIADWRKEKNATLIQGFLGGQGVGKTTLTSVLTLILKHLGYATVSLSIDDLYLPYRDRIQLQAADPRIIHRGPPGTHDIALGLQVLRALRDSHFPVQMPQFDKSAWNGAGDRTTAKIIHHADLVLFEGWFVGVRPVNSHLFETLLPPIVTEHDQQFARDMNDRLKAYLSLWELLDRLVVLYLPDYPLSKQWRKEAEHKMIAQGKAGMTDAEIDQFVEYFWKALHPELFITPLVQQAARTDLVIEINPDHTPGRIYSPR